MIFDLSNGTDIHRLKEKLNVLVASKKKVELKVFSPKRSLRHNAYLHLILSFFAVEYGEKLNYVKQEIFKKNVNPDIFRTEFVNEKTGVVRDDWRSTADLTDSELSKAINRFHDYSIMEAGIELPHPDNEREIEYAYMVVKNNDYWI
ncbi:hypothetical protein CMU19_04285 [Elizabethkingia anophelis]|nr:hypothetical protein [Elizabethkingia anophelis]